MSGKYTRTLWENNKTPLSADNLNKIEEGIETNSTDIETANTDINTLKVDVTGLKESQTETSKKLDSTSDKLSKIDSALENATITAHHSLSIIKETSWVRIAKIRDLEKTGSAIFNLECYGVIASTGEKNIFTASSFSISFGLTRRGEFAVDVLPLSQAPELNTSTASSPVSSGMLIGDDKDNVLHSADYGVWGATAVCLERYGEEVYVCVLFSYPPTDKYSSLELVLSLNNYLNITLLPTLEIVDLSEINTSTLNLLEGTEFRTKDNASEYIFNLSAKATDLKDYFLPEGSVDFSKTLDVKVINSNNEEYKLFNYKAEAYSSEKEYPDYLDKGVAQQKGYISFLTVDNKPYAISHPDFPYDLGHFNKEEPIKASSEAYPTEEYDLVSLVASPLKSSDNKTIPFEVAKNFKGTLHLSSAEGSDYSEVTLYYKAPQEVEPEKPTIPEPKVITFEFGYNGEATHKDGSAISEGKVYQEEDYTLQLNNVAAVYAPAYDAKGNSCIKLGTTSKIASFTIEVPEDVNKVSFFVANYKTTAANIKINGEAYSILNNSDDGKYDEIVIDTSETKTLTFETYKPGYRCMINSIKYHIISEEVVLVEEPIEEEEPDDTTDVVTSVTYTIDSSNPSVSIPFDTELYETILTINSGAVNIEFEFYLEDITFIYKIPFLALDDYENGFTLKEFHSNVDFLSITLTSNIFHGKSKSYSLRSIYNMLESKGAVSIADYTARSKAEEALDNSRTALSKVSEILNNKSTVSHPALITTLDTTTEIIQEQSHERCLKLSNNLRAINLTRPESVNVKTIIFDGTVEDWLKVCLSAGDEFDNAYKAYKNNPLNYNSSGSYAEAKHFYCIQRNESKELINLIIPETITKIGQGIFAGFNSVESIYIPKTVKEIETFAFTLSTNIYNLKELVFEEGTDLKIDARAFTNVFVDKLVLPTKAFTVDDGSARSFNYTKIKDLYIGKDLRSTVKVYADGTTRSAMWEWSYFKNLYINATKEEWFSNEYNESNKLENPLWGLSHAATRNDDGFFGDATDCKVYVKNQNNEYEELLEYVIPETDIESFKYVNIRCKLTLPQTIQQVQQSQFSGSGVYFETLPDSCTLIGEYSFNQCEHLKKVNTNNASVCASAFTECHNLTHLTIPYGLQIFTSAYKNELGFENLKVLDIGGHPNTTWKKILWDSNYSLFYKPITLVIRKTTDIISVDYISSRHVTAVYVPDNLLTQYKEATNWVNVADRIKPLSEYVEEN